MCPGLGLKRGALEATTLKAAPRPEKRDSMTVAGLQRAGGMAALLPRRSLGLAMAKTGCAPRVWSMGEGHSPSRVGQRLLKSEARLRKEPSLDWGQGGEQVSELGTEPSARTPTWALEGPCEVSPAPGAAGWWVSRGRPEGRQLAVQHMFTPTRGKVQ